MDKTYFEQPNQHYVDRLMNATGEKTIIATEDIYDSRGIKLWARGRPINVSLRERLVATKLKKPIEVCVSVEDGIKPSDLARDAQAIMDQTRPIAALADEHAPKVLRMFQGLNISGVPHLQLTTSATDGGKTLQHAVASGLISACIALRLGLDDSAAEAAIMAGLVHDMGEMYVNPELLHGKPELTFSEWKHIAVHPRIGAVLLSEYAKLPPPIVRAMQEHHERLDGSGYPFGSRGDAISQLGRILMVAEVLSAILPARENPEARALLAMRLVKGQFDPKIISLLSSIYRHGYEALPGGFALEQLARTAHVIHGQLTRCDAEAHRLADDRALPENWRELARHAYLLCGILLMSLNSSGVLSALDYSPEELQQDTGVANELHLIITELKWRLRALSRHVALSADRWERASEVFQPLVDNLYINDAMIAEALTEEGA